ncbi:MAG: GGDEF domain-containing protein [Nevskiales bacterium]|nr:GGDEF domain-containing protein [Nevskiales bacterium]
MRARPRPWRPGDKRYARQRRVGFPWLQFMSDLEQEYRQNYITSNALRFRASGTVGLVGVFGFLFADWLSGYHLVPGRAQTLLLTATVPALAVPLIVTLHPRDGARALRQILQSTVLVAFSALAVINMGRFQHPEFPHEAIYLVLIYVYFISSLLFYEALVCCLLLSLTYVVTNWPLWTPVQLFYQGFYLIMANAMSALGLYAMQREARLSFLMQNELRQEAALDGLTGLMNRRSFRNHLETVWIQAQREQATLGLLLLDLDGFKALNDKYGHPFGDLVLRNAAQILKSNLRRPLDAAGRYGGDEFIAVWSGVDKHWLMQLARHLPGQLEGSVPERPSVRINASGGAVLVWPRQGLFKQEAIRMADRKLYEMKHRNRGSIAFAQMAKPAAPVVAAAVR